MPLLFSGRDTVSVLRVRFLLLPVGFPDIAVIAFLSVYEIPFTVPVRIKSDVCDANDDLPGWKETSAVEPVCNVVGTIKLWYEEGARS